MGRPAWGPHHLVEFFDRLGVEGAHRGAALEQPLDDVDRGRVAHVVGLGLEGEPEHADGLAVRVAAERSTILSIMRSRWTAG